jgi:DNA-binding NarL/FixJ family response regulator
MQETKVMLVDDHRIFREGLRSLLEKERDITIVGEATNGRDCVSTARELHPDIIIMDVSMPDMNGMEATRQLGSVCKNAKVLALSMSTNRRQIQEMLRSGARGFLAKDSACEELLRAIKTIQEGNPYLSPFIQGIIMDDYVNDSDSESTVISLSSREREILQLIAEGVSTHEIAKKLKRCVKTVESHRSNIMEKVGVKNLPQLTKYAIQEGLTDLQIR